jgi:uncharacterized membrane protein YgcG
MKKLLIILLCFTANINAEEKILEFNSHIQVLTNGDIQVKELITVNSENYRIKHGITRDIPTIYFDNFLTHKTANINITNVTLDGNPITYHKQNLINGIRLYIGSKYSYVSKGKHTYGIEYFATHQVIELNESDGLYWNVTGNGWQFPILKASVDVYFPPSTDNINILKEEAWTGKQGSKDKYYQSKTFSDHIHFETTKSLAHSQGFTIQVTWPTGLITDRTSVTWLFIKNNIFWFLSVIMLIVYPLYFYRTWKKYGVDPEKGAIYPIFSPPNNVSPAAIRFITEQYNDSKSFSVAIMNLAVKKYISIEQKSKKKYILTKASNSDQGKLSRGEKRIYSYLFRNRSSITISNTYNSKIKAANDILDKTLIDEYKDQCYRDNKKLWLFGVFLSIVSIFFNWGHFFNFSAYAKNFIIMPLIAIIFSASLMILTKRYYQKLLVTIVPIIALFVIMGAQKHDIYGAYIAIIIFIVFMNALFYYLIQSPTVFGRKLLDKIEGFKLYLSTAEKDRLEIMHPPEMTPHIFEKYLPYAMALGVENKWSKQFNNAMKIQGKDANTYQPSWYIGNNYSNFNFATAATAIGAGLASSVVSAATPPSSNSSGGFGGGGFSGGGGGGGGGGGW